MIISNFTIEGGFNGLQALALALNKAPKSPFIFLAGASGEDRAIDALKSGAADYVLKERPKRLVPAIKRALRDVQEQELKRVAQEQILRMQRLENIGMLAAGIAHDFNNVLSPVLMAAPLLRERATDEEDRRMLTVIEQSAERGAELVAQILGFAQGVAGEVHEVQAKHLLHDLVTIMRQTFPKTIAIEDHIGGNLWPMRANPTHFHQIVLNLCMNARDAMPHGGVLRLRADNVSLDETMAATSKGGRAGNFVRIVVEDTGSGIAPEILPRIWEPFFTTKGNGGGTGLGLSTVRAIVEDHQGFATLDTRVGRGSRFEIHLPAAASAAEEQRVEPPEARQGAGELVLVVDDEPHVRQVAEAILTRNGYRVVTASDGVEALAVFVAKTADVSVVVADLDMPNLDGVALTKIIRSLNPACRVLAMTGTAEAAELAEATKQSTLLLEKPFTSRMLLHAVHQVLSSEPNLTGATLQPDLLSL